MSQRRSQRCRSCRNYRFELLEKRFALSAIGFGSGTDNGPPANDPFTNSQHENLRNPHQEGGNLQHPSRRTDGPSAGIPNTEIDLQPHHIANGAAPRENHTSQYHQRPQNTHHERPDRLLNPVPAGNESATLDAVDNIFQADQNGLAHSVFPPIPTSLFPIVPALLTPSSVSPTGSLGRSFSVIPASPVETAAIPTTSHFVTVNPVATQDRTAESETAKEGGIPSSSMATPRESTELQTAGSNELTGQQSRDYFRLTEVMEAKSNNGDRTAIETYMTGESQTGAPDSTNLRSPLGSGFTFEKNRNASHSESLQPSTDAVTFPHESLDQKINDLDNLLEAIAISRTTWRPDLNQADGLTNSGLHKNGVPISTSNPGINAMILLSSTKDVKTEILPAETLQDTEAMAIQWGVPLGLHRAVTFADPLNTITHGKAGHKDAVTSENSGTPPVAPDQQSVEFTPAAPRGLRILSCMMLIPYLHRLYRQKKQVDQPVEQR